MNLPITVRDLAPGDLTAAAMDFAGFEFARIRAVDHPLFECAYEALWKEFGARGEMESRLTLQRRFALAPAMLYEIFLIRSAGRIAAVRDHTAITADGGIVVHLSHNLVDPQFRRSGLAGWMRALPIASARECAAANALSPAAPVVFVAEMEYDSPDDAARAVRLRAYEKAGFKKVDPAVVNYFQPDFREPAEIDAAGGPCPLPFQIVLRQIGREGENSISGARLRQLVGALYRMYGAQFRPQDMAMLSLEDYPAAEEAVALLAPTSPATERPC